jgi:thiamine-monophosphate kinase
MACRRREVAITIGELGEFGLIARIARLLPTGGQVVLGIGDDAAVLRAPDGQVVATTDLVVEGRHFRRDWSAPREVGCKAAARSLADVAAMGGVPTALLVAFAAPAALPVRWAEEFTAGLAAECARAGAVVAGGDVAAADVITVAVTALGDLGGRSPVTRGGARQGDLVAVAGKLGHAAAGHALLTCGRVGPAGLVVAHRCPQPPYAAGPEAARLGATSMIDISDGLLADLGHVARSSKVRIELSSAMLPVGELLAEAAAIVAEAASDSARSTRDSAEIPSDGAGSAGAGPGGDTRGREPARASGRRRAAGRRGLGFGGVAAGPAALEWVLTGGEDHALVATFPPGTGLPPHWSRIGEVHPRGPAAGVFIDGKRHAGQAGWEHFR